VKARGGQMFVFEPRNKPSEANEKMTWFRFYMDLCLSRREKEGWLLSKERKGILFRSIFRCHSRMDRKIEEEDTSL